MDTNSVCFLAATLLLIHLHQAPCVSIMSPTARDDRPELAHVAQRREKRCSCENQKDKECIFFCHIGIVWVNTPSHLVPYGFGSVRLRRNLSRCLCTQTEDAECLSFCSFQSEKRRSEEEDCRQVEEEVPRCILGKRELGKAESEELRLTERSNVFIRAMMDGVHLQPIRGLVLLAVQKVMDRGESQFIEGCFLPVDISGGQVRPDATPLIRFESSDEEDNDIKDKEGLSSEPEGLSKAPRKGLPQKLTETPIKRFSRSSVSLHLLTRRFLQVMQKAPGCCVDLTHMSRRLQTHRRRLYDITSTLYGVQVIEKESKNRVRWIGKHPISVFLSNKQTELQRLKQVESTLDDLIKRCAEQLFDMTDDFKYSTWAYVTHEDIRLLQTFQEQTVIAVRAPEESKLEIPVPTEDSIQVHLTANQQPFTVLTCELGSGHDADGSACFLGLEDSRIRTKIQSSGLHRICRHSASKLSELVCRFGSHD